MNLRGNVFKGNSLVKGIIKRSGPIIECANQENLYPLCKADYSVELKKIRIIKYFLCYYRVDHKKYKLIKFIQTISNGVDNFSSEALSGVVIMYYDID